MRLRFIFFAVLSLSVAKTAQGVPPSPNAPIPTQATCKTNPSTIHERVHALKAAKAPFFQVPLSPTTSYVAVIRVDFSDKAMTKTKAQTESFMESLKSFYLENSYGLLTVSATVTNNVYRLTNSMASYAQGICSNYDGLAEDALSAANTDVNFADARSDIAGDQNYNHIMIYHAGIGAETASDSGCQTDNLWSVFAPTVPAGSSSSEGVITPYSADGVSFNGTTIVPESELQNIDPLGVICHEYGHQLGLPDLYKTSGQTVVGKWSLMDNGVYTGSPLGSNPSHLDAWSKQFLGFFSNPQTLTAGDSPQQITLELALSSANAFLRIPISGVAGVDGSKEYFLAERRARASLTGKTYDDALPFGNLTEGTMIWHVDDSIASDEDRLKSNNINNGSPHYGVDAVEANGAGVIATTNGKDTDPFPGAAGMTIFAAPLSNAFNGQQTGITLTGFSGSRFTLKKAFAADSVEISKTINFPNPGGPSYTQRSGAPSSTVTTIVLNTSRAPQKIKLTIHDLSGALVVDVPQSSIKANGSATATNKFVYEFDWNGKNGDGETAAPGVYLYRFKADDSIVQTGKMVLIR